MIDYYQTLRRFKVQTKSPIIKLFGQKASKNLKRENSDIYVVVTIDTEQDVDKRYTNTGTYYNIERGLPKLSDIFDSYGCKASWMVTPDVALNYPDLIKKLSDEKHEIGCHVHPEYFTEQSISHIQHRAYLCNLPIDLQRKMICDATDIIERAIGNRPTSFRAGKYGADNTTLALLENEGYLVDTSVSPCVNWSEAGGPDWSRFHTVQPYFQNKLLEVPLTIINVMGLNYWVRPSVSTLSTMETIVEILTSQQNEPTIINIMFHSMESVDPNPYIESKLLLKNLDNFLKYLKLKNANFLTLNELYYCFISREQGDTYVRV